MILTDDRTVGRDLHNVHAVDILELALFRLGGTGHTGLLLVFVKVILEGDRSERPALTLDLDFLLGLDGLVQAVRIAASGHQTSGKFINDDDLVVLDHVIFVTRHQVMRLQRGIDVVQDLRVLGIAQIVLLEILLGLAHAFGRQRTGLLLLVHDEVAFLLDFLLHDHGKLGLIADHTALLKAGSQQIRLLIQARGLAAASGNDQRRTGLIDQDRVDLVDDGIMQPALHHFLFVDDHVVTQIVKTELIIGTIGDIAVISLTARIVIHIIQDAADGQTQEAVHLAHPLRVTAGQIVIDGHDMYALALQRVQLSRKQSHLRLAFTCLHFSNTALMQDHTADQLYVEMLGMQYTVRRLTHHRISLGQDIIQRLALRQAAFEFIRLGCELGVGQSLHRLIIALDLLNDRIDPLDLFIARISEQSL